MAVCKIIQTYCRAENDDFFFLVIFESEAGVMKPGEKKVMNQKGSRRSGSQSHRLEDLTVIPPSADLLKTDERLSDSR